MVALAHVEATCIGKVADVSEIDFVLGAHVTAAERGLLKRYAALMAPGDVEKGPAVGPEQPLVGRENHKIRIETPYVHCQHASAVRRVNQEGRSPLPQRRADFFDVDQPAVRPVHRRDRGKAYRRST